MKPSLPTVSVIIPTRNCSASIALTLESIVEQRYPGLEIIAIDAGSTDHTLEILSSYPDTIRLGAVMTDNFYEMINKGIEMAKGDYVNILYPGDFYIHHHTLLDIMTMASEHDKPHLVYCGTLLRDGKSPVKFLLRHLDLELLRKGQQPTSLQGCWFRKDTFDKIGLFSTKYHLRGGFELLCRFCLSNEFRSTSLRRALTDYDLRWVTSRSVITHFIETFMIIFQYFGWKATWVWMQRQKDTSRILDLWKRHIRIAFLGRQ